MKKVLVISFILAVVVSALIAQRDTTESDRKFLCAFQCWKQQNERSKMSAALQQCLQQCKAPKQEQEFLSDDICATSRGKYACKLDNVDAEETVTESDTENQGLLNEEQIWEQYRSIMITSLTQGQEKPFLQLLPTPMDAIWDSEDPSQLKRVSNHVPYWGEYYQQSPFKIDEQYCAFLRNIKTDDKVVDAEAKKLADQYDNQIKQLGNQLKTENVKCTQQFLAQQTKGDFKTFMDSCLAKTGIVDQIEEKKIMFKFFTARAYGPEMDDLFDARLDCEMGADWYEHAGSLQKFRADARQGFARSLNVTVNAFTRVNYPRTWKEVSQGIKRPSSLNNSFFQFAIQDGKGWLTKSEKFAMEIRFKGYGFVRSVPHKWFRHSLLSKFRNGPFYATQQNLFGTNGTMRLKPTGFYLVYKPTMTLLVERADAARFTGSKVKSAGGFFSSRKESVSITTTNVSTDTVKVVIQSNSEDPVIVAIENELLP